MESDDRSIEGSEDDVEGYIDGMRDVLYRINQLDEAEVLSQEFIDEHKQHITGHRTDKNGIDQYHNAPFVSVYDLQNLLVPKQIKPKELYKAITGISPFIEEVCDSSGTETFLDESVSVERIVEAVMEAVGPSEPEKPVIPQFVADWIEEAKGRHHSLYEAMADYCSPEMNQWIQDFYHSDLFAKAWLNGYEIEQEPKYYAKIKGHENIGSNDKYWNYNTDMEELSIGDSE